MATFEEPVMGPNRPYPDWAIDIGMDALINTKYIFTYSTYYKNYYCKGWGLLAIVILPFPLWAVYISVSYARQGVC